MKRVLMPFAILGVALVVSYVLIRTPIQLEEGVPEVQSITVRVMEVQIESIRLEVESQGKVQAARQVNLSAAVAGVVEWISPVLEAGGYIEEGEPLIIIDSSDYETALARSKALLRQAQAEAEHASASLVRMVGLADQSLASISQLEDAQRSAEVMSGRLADIVASVGQAELELERTKILSPFNAIVESKYVERGQYVNRAQNVAVLFDADEVEVRVPLAISQLGFLDIPLGLRGELAESEAPDVTLIGMYGGTQYQWQGSLVRTEATIDATSNTVQTIIRVTQPSGNGNGINNNPNQIPLPIGLYVQAKISGKVIDNLIALPRNVIRNNNQVLVVDAENTMHFREVVIFRLEEDRVLISGGLFPGEVICISPIQAVVDGMSVQPIRDAG